MKQLKSVQSDLYLLAVTTVLVFIFGLAFGSPFMARASGTADLLAQSQQNQDSVFQGTIQRNGERFFLRASSGQIYQLDDPQHAQPYEGKNVRITGKLDSGAKLIHVERIDAA